MTNNENLGNKRDVGRIDSMTPQDTRRPLASVRDEYDPKNFSATDLGMVNMIRAKQAEILAEIRKNPALGKRVDMALINMDPHSLKPSQLGGVLNTVNSIDSQIDADSSVESGGNVIISAGVKMVRWVGDKIFGKKEDEFAPSQLNIKDKRLLERALNEISKEELGNLQPPSTESSTVLARYKDGKHAENITV